LIPADQDFSLLEFVALATPLAHMNNYLSIEGKTSLTGCRFLLAAIDSVSRQVTLSVVRARREGH
jgi:hypothetical protein